MSHFKTLLCAPDFIYIQAELAISYSVPLLY